MIPKSQWTIKPRNTLIIRFSYPDRSMTDEAAHWLYYRFPWKNVVSVNVKGLLPARNKAVANLVLKAAPHITDVIFMDRDIRPTQFSDPFLCLPHDLAGCKYKTGEHSDLHWHLPSAVHLGLIRIRRKVFEKIAAPWFEMPLTPDGCGFEVCECVDFHMKATRAGFTSAHAGWAEHEPSASWAH